MPRAAVRALMLTWLLALASFASAATESVSRIALGSCVRQYLPQPIWRAINAFEPQAFLFLGDNIYADTTSAEVFSKQYDRLRNEPGYRELAASCPVYAIWDDHDYGTNDGGANFSAREVSKHAFLEFFDVPSEDARRHREGIYYAAELGPAERRIQLILLDVRYFRSPWPSAGFGSRRYKASSDPTLTMLGEAQWRWLEQALLSPALLRILVSGIQVANDEHGFETWGHFPLERQRLLKLIRTTGATGVIIVSGDRHFGEISRMDEDAPYPLYDFTTSGMTHSAPRGSVASPNRRRVGDALGEINFGTIVVDWEQSDPLIRLQLRDVTGRVRTEQQLRLGELQ